MIPMPCKIFTVDVSIIGVGGWCHDRSFSADISFIERENVIVTRPSMSILDYVTLSSQSVDWYSQLLDSRTYTMPMVAKANLYFLKTFLNDMNQSSYLGDYTTQPSSSDELNGGRPLWPFVSTEIFFGLGSSDEDYEPNIDKEDYDDIDMVLEMDEMRNVLMSTSSFLHDINISIFDNTGFEDANDQNANQDLNKGICFSYIKTFWWATKTYEMKMHQTYKVIHSSIQEEEHRCPKYKNGCIWRIRIIRKSLQDPWQITQYSGLHTCVNAILL